MRVFRGVEGVPDGFGPSAVTVGKFDGVHLGHRDVIRQLCARADAAGHVPAVVTFDRNPLSVIRPDLPLPPDLVSPDQKVELLESAGVAAALVLEFTPAVAAWEPEEFVRRVLVDALHARVVLAGSDFRFGSRGAGHLENLRALGGEHGFEVVVIEDLLLDDAGTPRRASSTWVRELVQSGRVREAARVLGRPPSVRSQVVHGEKRGRELGYPTANLDPHIEGLLPEDGVYASWAIVDGERHGSAVSIGNNPTFEGVPQHQVEAHLLDRKLDLYDRTIELEFVERIRPMNRFPDAAALVAQLDADAARIRELLASEPGSSRG
ncbi:MAG: bifunctional riboflavin kinase/FAD synthetase [Schumannella sp.]